MNADTDAVSAAAGLVVGVIGRICESWSSATAGWEHAVGLTSAGTVLLAGAYAFMGLLVLTAARPVLRPPDWHARWLMGASVLIGLAAFTLLRLDTLVVLFMRSMARGLGWYAQRGPWQLTAVLALLAATVHLARPERPMPGDAPPQRRLPLRWGLGWLALLAGLRVISLHEVDHLMDWSIGPASLGRGAEVAGLMLVAAAAWPALRAR